MTADQENDIYNFSEDIQLESKNFVQKLNKTLSNVNEQ